MRVYANKVSRISLIKKGFCIKTYRDCLTDHVCGIINVTKDLLLQFHCLFYVDVYVYCGWNGMLRERQGVG